MDRRALIVTYYFPPLGGGGVQRMAKLVKFATGMGWQFTVITADEPGDIIARDPLLVKEIPQSAKIIRVPFSLLPNVKSRSSAFMNKSNFWKRYLSAFLYLPDSRKKWLDSAWKPIEQELRQGIYDVVLVSIPPYSLSFLVPRIQEQFQLPVILDMRDPWSLNPYKIYPTPLHRYLDERLERRAISQVKFGIHAYRRALDFYRQKIPNFDQAQWQVIPNGFDPDDFKELSKEALSAGKETFDIAFSGTIYSHINHPTPLFKAMAAFKAANPVQGAKVRFVFTGKAHINLKKLAAKFGLEKQIILHGYLPHKESLRVLNKADALCFVLDDRCKRSAFTVGGKVYEYLALKKPILALVPEEGEAADVIRQTASGVVISPQKIKEISTILSAWASGNIPQFSFNGIENYRREKQAEDFVNFFEHAIKER